MWNSKKLKLAILVPTKDTVYSSFAYCLTQLVKTTTEAGVETFLFFDSSTILLNQRNNLLEQARKNGTKLLIEAGLLKVISGMTTLEEVMRINLD